VTWVKICGTTNVGDALLAAEAGADALGFIFSESSRQVESEVARQIIARLPAGMEKVGVFVNPSLQFIREVVEKTGITRVQLHGEEDAVFLRKLGESLPRLKLTKAFRADSDLAESLRRIEGTAFVDSTLLDSGSPARPGGTGKTFDWGAAKEKIAQANLGSNVRWIIAGGLTPENVGEAIRLFRPWGVDVVSGVELIAGKKDASKLKSFVAAVRAIQLHPKTDDRS